MRLIGCWPFEETFTSFLRDAFEEIWELTIAFSLCVVFIMFKNTWVLDTSQTSAIIPRFQLLPWEKNWKYYPFSMISFCRSAMTYYLSRNTNLGYKFSLKVSFCLVVLDPHHLLSFWLLLLNLLFFWPLFFFPLKLWHFLGLCPSFFLSSFLYHPCKISPPSLVSSAFIVSISLPRTPTCSRSLAPYTCVQQTDCRGSYGQGLFSLRSWRRSGTF